MRLLQMVVGLLALLVASACGGDSAPTATPTPTTAVSSSIGAESTTSGDSAPGSAEYAAEIQFLKHADIEVAAGTKVVWTSAYATGSGTPSFHTVTSGKPGDADAGSLFDSGRITEGETFERTFSEAGEFSYFCEIHPQFMKAVVKVK